jgi:hypothetical protein
MTRMYVLAAVVVGLGLIGGCAKDAADPGLPSGSLFSATHDGTLSANPASGRVSNPNTRDGTPPWESAYFPTGTYPSRSPGNGATAPGGTATPGSTGPTGGGTVAPAGGTSKTSAVLPGDEFPYNVGREPMPARSPAVTVTEPGYSPASVYPNRAEAARGAGSPSLYPATPGGAINPDPVRNPTLYPKGPTGGRGYVGP